MSFSTKHRIWRQHDEFSDMCVDPSIRCRIRIRLGIEYTYCRNILISPVYNPTGLKSRRGLLNRDQPHLYGFVLFRRTVSQTILADTYIHDEPPCLDALRNIGPLALGVKPDPSVGAKPPRRRVATERAAPLPAADQVFHYPAFGLN